MKLYKFRPLSSCENFCRAKEIIKTGEFYFSDWQDMNDPMEGYFKYDKNDKNEKISDRIVKGKKGLKICSFSESWKSILMWSHYADSHKGICIEVEVDDSDCIKSKYTEFIENMENLIVECEKEEGDVAQKILSTKIILWEYEEERRVFKESAGFCETGKITKVYFGIKCKDYKQKLIKLCDSKNILTQNLEIDFNTNKMKHKT